jgi:hypothetical protein
MTDVYATLSATLDDARQAQNLTETVYITRNISVTTNVYLSRSENVHIITKLTETSTIHNGITETVIIEEDI